VGMNVEILCKARLPTYQPDNIFELRPRRLASFLGRKLYDVASFVRHQLF
jgi:hypothetical protein